MGSEQTTFKSVLLLHAFHSGNSQWQQFRVIGLYQTDFEIGIVLSWKKIPLPSTHSFGSLHPGFYGGGKKSILLFYLKRQKCTYECEEEKERGRGGSFTETPHDRRAFNPLSRAGRWIKYGASVQTFFCRICCSSEETVPRPAAGKRGKENVCVRNGKGWSYFFKQHYSLLTEVVCLFMYRFKWNSD